MRLYFICGKTQDLQAKTTHFVAVRGGPNRGFVPNFFSSFWLGTDRLFSIDEATRLTDRTIIPVLKGVSREVAEYHLDRFKDADIAGRVTTRQRN